MKLTGFHTILFLIFLLPAAYGQDAVDHWETVVMAGDSWFYTAGSASVPAGWKDPGFNTDGWNSGPGGIGYEDGDDATIIASTISLYMRRDFEILDTSIILQAILHADYDDGFVAYLNGVEIARSNIGQEGVPPAWDETALDNHEALMYGGGNPEDYLVPADVLGALLKNGTNTLAVEVHNRSETSSDLSAIFFFSVGLTVEEHYYRKPPDWFYAPFNSSNLPLMMIETNGQTITSGSRIVADMGLLDYSISGRRNYIDDPFNLYEGKISIRIRGSSSQMFPKKNYSFETQDENGENRNVPLLGMPTENDWILHGPYSDKTLIRNVLSYHIASETGRYAPRTRWCELFINNQYQGLYVLTEKIKQDNNRVNIARLDPADISGDQLTGGYIIQIDRDDPEEGDGWYSVYRPNVFYTYHDPGYDELIPVQKDYIHGFISDFETSVKYASDEMDFIPYINVASFADYFIATEIYRHVDAYKLSFYMYKEIDSNGGLLYFGPVWDLNLAYGNSDFGEEPLPQGWTWMLAATSSIRPFWIIDLMKTDTVKNCIACKWQELRAGKLTTEAIMQFIDENLEHIEEARLRNFERWPVLGVYVWPNYYVGTDYEDDVNFLKTWLTDRLQWMDENMVGNCIPVSDGSSLKLQDRVNVFPNPFTRRVTFSYETNYYPVGIEIFNSSGTLVHIEEINSGNGIHMDLEYLPPGLYIYRITSPGITPASGKLVKKSE